MCRYTAAGQRDRVIAKGCKQNSSLYVVIMRKTHYDNITYAKNKNLTLLVVYGPLTKYKRLTRCLSESVFNYYTLTRVRALTIRDP